MIDPHVSRRAQALAGEFRNAQPFRHVVIEDFFTPEACAKLLVDFPAFERGNARKRDQHNQRLYRDVTHLTGQLECAEAAISAGNVGRFAHLARRVLRRLGVRA